MRKLPHISTLMLALVLAIIAVVLFTDAAYAAANGGLGGFSCSGGSANGQLYSSGASCPTSLHMSNIFSFLVCNIEQLSSNLMGHMYCGMVAQLTPAVWAAATLAILFFGLGFTIGVIPATGRDATLFLLKIAFVTSFATNADLLIGIGYNFLISGMQTGVNVVLSGLGGTYTTGDSVYSALDGFLATALHYATDGLGAVAGSATEDDDRCKNAVFAVIATMSIAFPIISYLAIMLVARIAITFLRAVFGYTYALVGITFLLTLAPLFIPFYLFKPTRSFFDKWIGYLVSFSLQIVLLFAFLAFILSIPATSMTSNLTDVIIFKAQTMDATSFRFPWKYCTLCDFKIVDKNNPSTLLTAKSPNFIRDGKLVCITYPIDASISPTSEKFVDAKGRKAIEVTSAWAPKSGNTSELSSLLLLGTNGILAFIVLAILVEQLLGMIPRIAQTLTRGAGASYSPALGGGGASGMPLPFEGQMQDFSAGFTHGMGVYDKNGNANLLPQEGKGLVQGVKDGFSVMVTGKATTGKDFTKKDAAGNKVAAGLQNQYRPLIGNPLPAPTPAPAPAPAPTSAAKPAADKKTAATTKADTPKK